MNNIQLDNLSQENNVSPTMNSKWTPEYRREYMKNYYAQHKQRYSETVAVNRKIRRLKQLNLIVEPPLYNNNDVSNIHEYIYTKQRGGRPKKYLPCDFITA